MYVENLYLENYRNFEKISIELNEKLNLFIGDNAQGKTNLIEAIFYISIGRSFRFSKDSNLIMFEKDRNYIKIKVQRRRDTKEIEVEINKDKNKTYKINKLTLEKNSELVGIVNIVIFSPDNLDLIKGSPGDRRKFLNIEISQLKPKYKYLLKKYKKILLQRNNLLKKMNQNTNNYRLLEVWDEHLIETGSEIIQYRNEFINKIKKISKKIHWELSGEKEKLNIIYKTGLGLLRNGDLDYIKEKFENKLIENREREIERGITLYGPHLDDMKIIINSKNSRYYSSQGQKRTAALSLKLSEIDIIREEKKDNPIVLLDDVLSELDNKRRSHLLKYIEEVQTIITSTDDSDLLNLLEEKDKKIFYINNGKITNIIE
ncbi:MAG: DNA replication/repair protein RecF [Bacillota bacterium]|nr:DNA replication/repair protein RecF [Bacillota bacterium]